MNKILHTYNVRLSLRLVLITIPICYMKYYLFTIISISFLWSCNQSKVDSSKPKEMLISNKQMAITAQQGVVTKKSVKNFEETYNTLIEVITNNPNLKIIAQLDHQANAASVGLTLNPTRIVMFGNPKLGTPLMQNSQTTGLDLPQKIVVWQDDEGAVKISFNDPSYLQKRHSITDKDDIIQKVSNALNMITNKAAGLE